MTGAPADLTARDNALREHATQARVFQGYYALSNDVAARLSEREGYLIWGTRSQTVPSRPRCGIIPAGSAVPG